jgi:hypothetical protein
MGIGKNSLAISVFFSAVAAVLLFAAPSSQARERNSGIWRVLREGHFSGPMNEKAQVRPIKGSITAQGKRYRFWEYYWKNGEHGGSGLLVFEQAGSKLSYLGGYHIDLSDFHGPVHPEIRGKVVFFPYKDIEAMGVKIPKELSFENGPPAQAHVGGWAGGEFSK